MSSRGEGPRAAPTLALALATALSGCSGAIPDPPLTWRVERDSAGRVSRSVGPSGSVDVRYLPKPGGRGTQMVRGWVTHEFDEHGRRVAMEDGSGKVRYAYDGFDRLVSAEREGAPAIAYAYGPDNRVASITVAGRTVAYAYDALGRTSRITLPGDRAIVYGYGQDRDGPWAMRGVPNGIYTVWRFDPWLRVADVQHYTRKGQSDGSEPIFWARFRNERSPEGRVVAVNEAGPYERPTRTLAYAYDEVGRLASVADSGNGTTTFSYDPFGNRTEMAKDGSNSVPAEYDWAGRLVRLGGRDCRHDAGGNLTRFEDARGPARFTFDADGSLTSATRGDPGRSARYRLDGDGKIVAREAGGATTTYLPDPLADSWRPLLEDGPGGTILYAWDGDTPLAAISGSRVDYYFHDHLGSVRMVVDDSGTTARRDFGPFGEPIRTTADDSPRPGFAGLFYDPVAGLYLGRRAYEPALGRFLARDPRPRLPSGSPADFSPYAYCGDDPVNYREASPGGPEPAWPFVGPVDGLVAWSRRFREAGGWVDMLADAPGPDAEGRRPGRPANRIGFGFADLAAGRDEPTGLNLIQALRRADPALERPPLSSTIATTVFSPRTDPDAPGPGRAGPLLRGDPLAWLATAGARGPRASPDRLAVPPGSGLGEVARVDVRPVDAYRIADEGIGAASVDLLESGPGPAPKSLGTIDPGPDEAGASGSLRLEETDLEVPIAADRRLRLARRFDSSTRPVDAIGGAWTLDLPRLDPIGPTRSRAVGPDAGDFSLSTPLNTASAIFSEWREGDPWMQLPTAPGPIFARTALGENPDLRGPTRRVVFRGGVRWFFDESSRLVAVSDRPFLVFLGRDRANGGRVVRLSGTRVNAPLAHILLDYDKARGVLASAEGSDGSKVTYHYNADGLERVERPTGTRGYRYRGGRVSAITQDGRTVREFAYDGEGRLVEERREGVTLPVPALSKDGSRIVTTPRGGTAEFDREGRLRSRVEPDGSRLIVDRRDSGEVELSLTLPDGRTWVEVRTADRKSSTIRAPAGGSFRVEYDDRGHVARIIPIGPDRPSATIAAGWGPAGTFQGATAGWTRATISESDRSTAMSPGRISLQGLQAVPLPPDRDRWFRLGFDELGSPTLAEFGVGTEGKASSTLTIGRDSAGRPVALDLDPIATRIVRDGRGRISEVAASIARGSSQGVARWSPLERVGQIFDGDRLATVEVDRAGARAVVAFDRGRPSRIRQFDRGEVRVVYHAEPLENRVKAIRTPNDLLLLYEYDAEGRVVAVDCDRAYRVEFRYDAKGRLVERTERPSRP